MIFCFRRLEWLLIRMNLQQVGQPKSFNGYGRRKSEREGAFRSENKIQSGKSNSTRLASTVTGPKVDNYESPSRDRLLYIATCLIGQQVEVHVKSGFIYSGIFHAANADKDFGIILKMARLMKASSVRGKRSGVEFVSQAPSKTLIISGKDLVQIMAKDVAVSRDDPCGEAHHEMHQEIMVDSAISQARRVEMERELLPWVPDGDEPQCPELENIFDGAWNRGWDQFETNETLFGVKSTFNEELYTTKLEKGPHMRDLEKQALRIAREIEGEETQDLHLAEERGIHLHEDFDIDEEARFSSVYRGKGTDDSGYDEREDVLTESQNSETFGGTITPVIKKSSDLPSGEGNDGALLSSNSSLMDLPQSTQSNIGVDVSRSSSYDPAKQLASELPAQSYASLDGERRVRDSMVDQYGANGGSKEENQVAGDDQPSKSEDSESFLNLKKDGSDEGELNASSCAPSFRVLSSTQEKAVSPGDIIESSASGKVNGDTKSENSHGRPGSSASSASECVGGLAASSGPGLSPSSSVGSLSSERSALNPNAKEFKLNPNARSFIPSQTSLRPPSPVADASFYFPTNVTSVPHMPTMSIGMGPTFTGPHVMYNPPVAQVPLTYVHPNVPQYGQLLGHPRQGMYMPPGYLPETQYRGRDY
ncbi:polyadenylate-binding protein-interacting protein 4-like isoform X3 [Prosopis cineraria]|uniref:polyadenylate-binding protein-interacting protein 4-like isoform X3 n=1 Tax=Prosopis cineraria TaxID=364024 RepID=UPI00240F6F76|nr:polyadenylate-binding protein-interacting protein 4-like isoform X3 [Prosopis cineraria]